MTCIAGTYNITCDQGATFSRSITWTDSARNPYNITGYTARMHVRETANASSTIVTLTTSNSRITLGGTAGTITLTIAATDTANLTPGLYVYDLELVSGAGVVSRIIEGNFKVKAEVTR
jgi:tRNA threonylcarbamoyladenosine modification (KEOPS) complex  Pcc1 subunit